MFFLVYKIVFGVNGLFVILDDVKVKIICIVFNVIDDRCYSFIFIRDIQFLNVFIYMYVYSNWFFKNDEIIKIYVYGNIVVGVCSYYR